MLLIGGHMSSVNTTKETSKETLSAEECKSYFEIGTQPLVDLYTAISESKSPAELADLLTRYHKARMIELREQEEELQARMENLVALSGDANTPLDVFAQQKEVSIARLADEIASLHEQIDFLQDEAAEDENITSEQQMFSYKTTANLFLSARQRVLDTWDANYNANPLTVVGDIDDETIAMPADGTDIGTWINNMLNKSLGETASNEGQQ